MATSQYSFISRVRGIMGKEKALDESANANPNRSSRKRTRSAKGLILDKQKRAKSPKKQNWL